MFFMLGLRYICFYRGSKPQWIHSIQFQDRHDKENTCIATDIAVTRTVQLLLFQAF